MALPKKKKKPDTSAAKSKARRPASDATDDVDLAGAPALVERFRAAAEALPASAVRPLRGSARLMSINVARGAASVLGEQPRLAGELPRFDAAAARALPDLGLATAWAAEEVVRFSDENPSEVRAMLKRAGKLRTLLLGSLESAAEAGLIPAAPVAKIREGRGGFDTAGDCVASAGLFQKHAAKLKAKTPVTAADVKEAAALGAQLLAVLQPKGARKKEKAAALKAALDLRDRLGALLAQGHGALRRAGGWLFGEALDERVPLLLANAGPGRKKTAPAAPTP
jgi:hypothetical protein